MREIHLNGYIDDAEWFGDEITPESLHEMLYPPGEGAQDDLRIILNSYGGSCNAAVRMFDDLRAYPGNVHIIVSGTAASAATVLATAADRLEMTPGSLWMIHDPSVMAWGNERDLEEAIRLLRACKESILNVYSRRCRKARDEVGAMMRDTTWMDAGAALQDGFIDGMKEGEPDRLLGYRLVTSTHMPVIAADAKPILFGDLSSYWIADREGRSMQRLNELYAATGQVGFRVTQRVDGRLVQTEGVKCLAMKSA